MQKARAALILVFLTSILLIAVTQTNSAKPKAKLAEWNQFNRGSAHDGYSSSPGPTTNNLAWTQSLTGNNFGPVSSSHILLASTEGISA